MLFTQDSNGEFTIPKEYIGSPHLVKKGEKKEEEEEADGFVSE